MTSDLLSTAIEAARLEALRRYDVLDTPPDGAFDRVTRLAARLFGVPIALVSLVDEDRIWFKSRVGLDEVSEIPREPGLCASAILSDDLYLVEDARSDPRTLANTLVAGSFGLQFYAAAPLVTGEGHRLGTLCLLDRLPRGLSDREQATLSDLAGVVMDEMELRLRARLTVGAAHRERVAAEARGRAASIAGERQRSVAHVLQQAMLPTDLPAMGGVELAVRYRPASDDLEAGGDWYDAFVLPDGRLGLVVGDTMGHDAHAAAVMGQVRTALRSCAVLDADPATVLDRLEHFVQATGSGELTTLVFAAVDIATGGVEIANAGHPWPIVIRGDIEPAFACPSSTRALGLGLGRTADTTDIGPQGWLVLFTDGLVERRDEGLDTGMERLRRAIAEAPRDPEAMCDRLVAECLGDRPQRDDAALLVLHLSPD